MSNEEIFAEEMNVTGGLRINVRFRRTAFENDEI